MKISFFIKKIKFKRYVNLARRHIMQTIVNKNAFFDKKDLKIINRKMKSFVEIIIRKMNEFRQSVINQFDN